MIKVRFAPNPNAHLSLSGARVALFNYLFARKRDGSFLLRFDDLDQSRCKPEMVASIETDLRWFGVSWDATLHQAERSSIYQAAAETLKQAGRLYPCFELEEELRAKRDFRQRRGQSPIYDRAMLKLTLEQRMAAEAGGKRPHWRFRLADRPLEWQDLVHGTRHAQPRSVSDPILVRADESPSPLLASVVDDIEAGITHVIRAEDNVGNTGVQIELFAALGADPSRIRFGHLPPLTETGGRRLGRRVGSLSIRSLRADGVEAGAIAACVAEAVTDSGQGVTSPSDLVASFRSSRLPQVHGKFDTTRLLELNRAALRQTDFAEVADRLPAGATEAFWLAVRGSIDLLNEARGWWDVVAGSIVPPVIEDEHELLATAHELLPMEPWGPDVWRDWMAAVNGVTGRDGARLELPLRLALTGEEHGPDLCDLLPLIGRTRAAARLEIAAA